MIIKVRFAAQTTRSSPDCPFVSQGEKSGAPTVARGVFLASAGAGVPIDIAPDG